MATTEQKNASRAVMDAVTALNAALLHAGCERLHIELQDARKRDMIFPQYRVVMIEAREAVLP
jgi:hypothetical protein